MHQRGVMGQDLSLLRLLALELGLLGLYLGSLGVDLVSCASWHCLGPRLALLALHFGPPSLDPISFAGAITSI